MSLAINYFGCMNAITIEFIKDGQLTFPLYHATSSLFRESILKHGLGGHDPINELKVVELLCKLIDHKKNYPIKEGLWFYLENMAQQIVSSGSNWQHGQVYLTSSRLAANNYAKHQYGSELITETLNLYLKLGRPDCITAEDHPVLKLLGTDPKPIVFKLNSMPISILAGEKGDDIHKVLSIYEECLQDDSRNDNFNFLRSMEEYDICFRLLKPTPIKFQGEIIWATAC